MAASADTTIENVDHSIDRSKEYDMGSTLGEGASCKVVKATRRKDKKEVAVKEMSKKRKVHGEMYKKETEILVQLKHPNIVKLIDYFQSSSNYFIVTELSDGGELFDRIVSDEYKLTEGVVAKYIMQMLQALKYIHDKNIVHRDLKPENFIMKTKKPDSSIVLIDFGTAKQVEDDTQYTDLVGTPFYLAPESATTKKKYRTGKMLKASDIWSVGVIAYICMTGSPPFYGGSNQEICRSILKNKVVWPANSKASGGCKKFVDACLTKPWKKRIGMDEALQHAWFFTPEGGDNTDDRKIEADIVRSLRQFNYQTKLKKAVAQILQKNMGKGPAARVEKHFKTLDTDGDNLLSESEVKKLFIKSGYEEQFAVEEAKKIMREVDKNGDGQISLEEFSLVWQRKLLAVNDAYIKAVFGVLDSDGDGFVTASELATVLEGVNQYDVAELIKEADSNGDHKIDLKEFKHAMKERIPAPPNSSKISANDRVDDDIADH